MGSWLTGSGNIDKLHDDYYNGKISLDELNRRAGNTSIPITWGASTRLVDFSTAFTVVKAR